MKKQFQCLPNLPIFRTIFQFSNFSLHKNIFGLLRALRKEARFVQLISIDALTNEH